MPDGVVEWYDEVDGQGRIVRRGHRYTVLREELDPHGRYPGARVHFDIDRRQGDVAVNATAIAGRARHHRRAGSLAGKRNPDQASGPSSASEPPLLTARTEHRPLRIGELWAALAAAGDVENLTRLYAPHAVVRSADATVVGPASIGTYWSRSDLLGRRPESVSVRDDGRIEVTWAPATTTLLSVAHGEIEDQWLGEVRAAAVVGLDETVFTVSSAGEVSDLEWNAAVDEVGGVLAQVGEPILAASLRLEQSGDPGRERGAVASVMLDLDGSPVRARAEAGDMAEAIHRLTSRLRDRLRHLSEQRLADRHRGAEHVPGQWRHGDRPADRGPFFERPADERDVVRRKSFAVVESTVEEAIFDLESLDHDFFLFTDLATGDDALVRRDDDGGYGVDQLADAPTYDLTAARSILDGSGHPWVFFRDADTGRGRVLYRRFDGHYGLITLAT